MRRWEISLKMWAEKKPLISSCSTRIRSALAEGPKTGSAPKAYTRTLALRNRDAPDGMAWKFITTPEYRHPRQFYEGPLGPRSSGGGRTIPLLGWFWEQFGWLNVRFLERAKAYPV